MNAHIAERKELYRVIRNLPDDKAARVISYIKALQEEEPPLTSEEEAGLREAYAELAAGKGKSFREAMKTLW